MAIESSKDPVGPARRSPIRIWDQPDGLGREVWRRAQSTPISAQALQRSLARYRRDLLKDPVPLASEIRARWSSSGYGGVARFGGDLPLFPGHSPNNHHGSWPENSHAWPGSDLPTENPSISAAAHASGRFPIALTRSLVSEPGVDAVAHETVLASQWQRADDSDSSDARSLAPFSLTSSRSTTRRRLYGLVSPLSVAGTPVPARVAMSSPLAVPIIRRTWNQFRAAVAGQGSMPILLRAASFNGPRSEGDFDSMISRPGDDASPPLVSSTTIVAQPVHRQVSTASAAISKKSESSVLSMAGRSSEGRLTAIDRRNISSTALAESSPATVTAHGSTPTASHDVGKNTIKPESSKFGLGASGAAFSLGSRDMMGLRQTVTGSAAETGQTPTTLTRSTTYNQAGQLHPDMIGKRIFSFVKGVTISQLFQPGFGSGSRNAPLGPKSGNGQSAATQTIQGVSAASGANQTSVDSQIIAGQRSRSADSPAARQPTAEVVEFDTRPLAHPGTSRTDGGNIARAEGSAGVTVRSATTPIISRSAALPLSSGSVRAPANSPFRDALPRGSSDEFEPSGARGSRAAADRPSSGSVTRSSGEGGMGIAVFSRGDFLPAQSHEAAAENNVVYPLLSRITTASSNRSIGSTGSVRSGSSVYDDGFGNRLGETYGPSRFDAPVLRKFMPRAEFSGNRDSTLGSSPGVSLPLIEGGLLSPMVFRASALGQRDSARVARSPAMGSVVGDSLPDSASLPQSMQSTGGFSTGILPQARAETFSVYPSWSAGLTPMLLSTRSTEMATPTLLRSFVKPVSFAGHIGSPGARETSYDMPLAMRPVAAGERVSSFAQPAAAPSLQSVRQETPSPVSQALPVSGAAVSASVGAVAAAGVQPKIDLDEIVEKAWQKLMRKLTMEQERRGYARWL